MYVPEGLHDGGLQVLGDRCLVRFADAPDAWPAAHARHEAIRKQRDSNWMYPWPLTHQHLSTFQHNDSQMTAPTPCAPAAPDACWAL